MIYFKQKNKVLTNRLIVLTELEINQLMEIRNGNLQLEI